MSEGKGGYDVQEIESLEAAFFFSLKEDGKKNVIAGDLSGIKLSASSPPLP